LGNFISGKLEVGEKVKLKIDSQKRLLNAKNHTVGHLIDLAIESLNLPLIPLKGYHFPVGAYVEYSGNLEIENAEFAQILKQKVNQIIATNPKISFNLSNFQHTSGKPMRIMEVEGYKSCPCGGTHIRSTVEIGQIKIRKIKNTKGNLRISYTI
jgi:Ser-tRNA(Ala) deacylase AlaX